MVRISRQKGESLILYAENPSIRPLGYKRIEIWVKKVKSVGNGRVGFATTVPKDLPVLNGGQHLRLTLIKRLLSAAISIGQHRAKRQLCGEATLEIVRLQRLVRRLFN
ncbi:MAG: hypothetical protein P8173_06210 [Gammaproteobacteria bacterium]|jgi:hypothetical protein